MQKWLVKSLCHEIVNIWFFHESNHTKFPDF